MANAETDSAGGSRTADDNSGRPTPWWRRLGVHAAALLVALLALVPLFDPRTPSLPDEGLYAAQVEALARGSWSLPRPATDLDPTGELDPWGASIDGDRVFPYPRRPLYPVLLVPFRQVFGLSGLLVVSALGTWVAALAAARIAGRMDRRLEVGTLWLVGAGSPLLYGATVVLGNAPAAAASGLVVLAVLNAIATPRPRRRWLGAAAIAAAVLVFLRSEGILVVAGLAATLVVVGTVSQVRRRRGEPSLWWAAATVATAGLVAFGANSWWARTVTPTVPRTTSVVTDRDPLNAAWVALVRPWEGLGLEVSVPLFFTVLAIPLAVLSLRIQPRRALLPVALLAVGAVAAVALQWQVPELMTGLVPAFPAVTAVALLGRRDLVDRSAQVCAGTAVVAAIAILATVYGDGGTTQWGGRFFWVLIPLLGPLAAAGLARGRDRLDTRVAAGCLVAVVLIIASIQAVALRSNATARAGYARAIRPTVEVAQAEDAPVLLVLYQPFGLGRMFWYRLASGEMTVLMVYPFDRLGPVLERAAAGRDRLVILTDAPPDIFLLGNGSVITEAGWGLRRPLPTRRRDPLVLERAGPAPG